VETENIDFILKEMFMECDLCKKNIPYNKEIRVKRWRITIILCEQCYYEMVLTNTSFSTMILKDDCIMKKIKINRRLTTKEKIVCGHCGKEIKKHVNIMSRISNEQKDVILCDKCSDNYYICQEESEKLYQ
jgi:hypothetical protein